MAARGFEIHLAKCILFVVISLQNVYGNDQILQPGVRDPMSLLKKWPFHESQQIRKTASQKANKQSFHAKMQKG
mgnify:CR=1